MKVNGFLKRCPTYAKDQSTLERILETKAATHFCKTYSNTKNFFSIINQRRNPHQQIRIIYHSHCKPILKNSSNRLKDGISVTTNIEPPCVAMMFVKKKKKNLNI